MLKKVSDEVKRSFEDTFMFYLPRICEHCLNPSCAASCPSGAIYKRAEDGIVLVDQDRCRGWRMCVSGCPYKKVYFNHRTGKAEKCTFCFPRIEVGLPTVCSETCVGRLRYIGLVLYDADRVLEAASTPDEHDLYEAQRSVLLDPNDPEVVRAAERDGIPHDWVEAAQRSPIHALINSYKVALPLHPEYRTMPMVWYIPPLSPVVDVVKDTGEDAEDPGNLFAAIDALRIPIEYLAELFTAGDVAPVDRVLQAARRDARPTCATSTSAASPTGRSRPPSGMSEEEMYDMYRLLAMAKYDERYVIPPAHAEQAHALEELATECSLDYEGGPGMGGSGPFGEGSGGRPTPIAVENFQMLRDRQTSDTMAAPETRRLGSTCSTGTARARPRAVPADGARPVSGRAAHARGRPATVAVRLACCSDLPRRASRHADLPSVHRAAGALPTPLGTAALLRAVDLRLGRDARWTACRSRLRRDLRHAAAYNLFLTYFAHGDTRKRGVALLRFKQTYLRAGCRARRRRAARPPLRRARVRRDRRPQRGPAAAARPPSRPRAAAAVLPRTARPWAGGRRGRLRDAAAAARRRVRKPISAGSPPRGRRPRRSA